MSAQGLVGILLSGLPTTVLLFVVSGVAGLIVAVLVTIPRIVHIRVLSPLATAYVSFTRSVPVILLLFLAFYGIPAVAQEFGLSTAGPGAVIAAIMGLTWNHSGYLAEVIRPAYLIIDEGQREAARAFAYSRRQELFRVLLPQIIPIVLPGYGNALIFLMGNTSLAYVIGTRDIMAKASAIMSSNGGTNATLVYAIIALVYCALVLLITLGIRWGEQRTSKYRPASKISVRGI